MNSVLINGLNFYWNMLRWAAQGFPVRTEQEIKRISDICQSCEFLSKDRTSCEACGCCIQANRLLSKLTIATTECPKGKW